MKYLKEKNIWHGLSLNKIYNMDCIEGMKLIPDGSVDCIITDPPYWTTACKWDTIIPFDLMWEQLKRIIKPNGAIVLFWSEPFSSALRMSNIKQYKYDIIWDKMIGSSFVLCNKRILPRYENICLFWKWTITYNPIMEIKEKHKIRPNNNWSSWGSTIPVCWWVAKNSIGRDNKLSYPTNIIAISSRSKECNNTKRKHPTQKPVEIMEYLIKTYTNEWELVLDFTMWSWTTAVACVNTNRNFIWFELDEWYRNIANKRIQDRLSDRIIF